jgi:hypothetical protein
MFKNDGTRVLTTQVFGVIGGVFSVSFNQFNHLFPFNQISGQLLIKVYMSQKYVVNDTELPLYQEHTNSRSIQYQSDKN